MTILNIEKQMDKQISKQTNKQTNKRKSNKPAAQFACPTVFYVFVSDHFCQFVCQVVYSSVSPSACL